MVQACCGSNYHVHMERSKHPNRAITTSSIYPNRTITHTALQYQKNTQSKFYSLFYQTWITGQFLYENFKNLDVHEQ